MMRYSIGDEDTELFSEHRTPGGAVRNVVTEAPRSASFQILPPKQAEVFQTPEECHNSTSMITNLSVLNTVIIKMHVTAQ